MLLMKTLLCAAVAAMVMSTGTAFAKGGGGDGGESNFVYQLQQQSEAHLINQEHAWQIAHAREHGSVALAATTAPGGNGGAPALLADAGGGETGGRQPTYA
jgi:hypothetical protein